MKSREELLSILILIRNILDAEMERVGSLTRREQQIYHLVYEAIVTHLGEL